MSESRSVKVTLKANVADFTRQLKSASTSLEDLAAKGDKTGKVAQTSLGRMAQSAQLQREAWSTTSTALLGYSAAVTGAIGVAVKKFADFDEAMSMVQADTHETAGNMELLRAAALQAGADTQYSATEAAQAVDELAKAGMSTSDILGGGLSGALDLAAAGSLDVADAAETAASAMTMFGLKGSDINHVADLLAAGAGKAQGSVGDLSAALNNVGPVAANTGLSIDETTGFLAAMASYGLTGAEAGTQLKSMLQSLQAPSSTARKAMDELGLSLYDSEGKTKSLTRFVGEYQASLKGRTQAEKDSANATIFGSYGITAATVAYNQGAQGISEWISKVNDSGYAASTAKIKMNNLKGDIEALMGSLETGFIQVGSMGNDALRGGVQGLTEMVNAFNELPAPVKGALVGLGGFSAGAAGVVGISMKVFTSLVEVKSAFDSLKGADGVLGGLVSKLSSSMSLGGVAMAAAPALLAMGGALMVVANNAEESNRRVSTLASTLDRATGAITDNTRAQMASNLQEKGLFKDAERYGISLRNLTDAAMGNADAQVAVADQLEAAKEKMREANEESGLGHALTEAQTTATGDFQVALKDVGAELDDARAKQQQMAEATGEGENATTSATGAISEQTSELQKLVDAQNDAAGNVLSVRDAQRNFEQAVDDASAALEKNGKTLDITTEAGRANQDALDGIADSGRKSIESLKAVDATDDELQASMQATREKFIAAAESMGMSSEEAEALADKLNLIPTNVTTTVYAKTEQAKADIDTINRMLKAMPNGVINFSTTGYGEVYSYLTAIQNQIRAINGSSVRVAMGAGGQGGITFATGGAVFGAGTATSDSIPAWLSNGEHVIPAGEVQAAGGQSAVYQLRALLRTQKSSALDALKASTSARSGGITRQAIMGNGYAQGGAVEYRSAPIPASYTQPATRTVVVQQDLPDTVVLNVGDQQFTAYVDKRATLMAQQQQRAWSRA